MPHSVAGLGIESENSVAVSGFKCQIMKVKKIFLKKHILLQDQQISA
jgi:hypothetical protein